MTSGIELGNTQALTHMIESMRKGKLEVVYNDTPLEIGRKLGEGNTKTVYDAIIEGNPFALGLPNTVDSIDTVKTVTSMVQEWTVALQEPANTDRIRAMGLFVNPTCEVMRVDINGVPFPILKMTRYQDLSFQVMDGSNSHSSTIDSNLLPEEFDDAYYEEHLANMLPDLQVLTQNGAQVNEDSINICIVDRKPRIYFSDLGDAEFELIPEEGLPGIAKRYTMHLHLTFKNGLTEAECQKHRAFFDSNLFRANNSENIYHRLNRRLLHLLCE